jgi:solute carrier family 25 phosphate transporter 23/24/25/41
MMERYPTPVSSMSSINGAHTGTDKTGEFHTFVRRMEYELRSLFKSIDKNGDGKLDKSELQAAFKKAGLTVSSRKIDQFFDRVDLNHDGVVSFQEWRWVLLLQ